MASLRLVALLVVALPLHLRAQISYLPQFNRNPTTFTVTAGEEVTLNCSVISNPVADITIVLPSGGSVNGRSLGIFTIVSITPGNAGIYVCTASNSVGTVTLKYTVNVKYAPQFSGNMTTLRLTAGENATLNCSVDSNPAATISIVTPSDRDDIFSSNGTFIIPSITPGDAGTYVCTANNSVGDVTLNYKVEVEYAPLFSSTMETLRIIVGERASLNCSVDSNPTANINITTPSNIVRIMSDGIFTIPSITRVNAGTYVCTANNYLGDVMLNYTLDVLYGPQFSGNTTTLRLTAGENATLDCSVDSNPAATISIVTPSDRDVIFSSNGTFIIPSITPGDAGTYVCTANNSVGDVTLNYTVEVEYAPQFNTDVKTLIFTVGEKATLDCSVDSNPAATITIVTPSGISVNISSDGIFVISNITSDKAGTYVFTANNSLGDAMLNYTVDVEYAPRFNGRPTILTLVSENNATIDCTVDSNPPAVIIIRTPSGNNVNISSNGIFTISNLYNIAGTYQCTAKNSLGEVSLTHKVGEEEAVTTVIPPFKRELDGGGSCDTLTVGLVVFFVSLILGALLGIILTIVFLKFCLKGKKQLWVLPLRK